MNDIIKVVSNISTPIALAGVIATFFFFAIKGIVKKDIFPKLTKSLSSEIIQSIIHKLFILSLVAMILGFIGYISSLAFQYYGVNISNNSNTNEQIGYVPYSIVTSENQGHISSGIDVVIRKGGTVLRVSPSLDSPGSVLSEGSRATVINLENSWVKIRLKLGRLNPMLKP